MCIFEAVATESDIICPFLWQLKRNRLRGHSFSLFHLTEVSHTKKAVILGWNTTLQECKIGCTFYSISYLMSTKQTERMLRVDNEHTTLLQKEELRGNNQCLFAHKGVCLFMPRRGLGLRGITALQQGHACCTWGNDWQVRSLYTLSSSHHSL